jgi:hypothetical protein
MLTRQPTGVDRRSHREGNIAPLARSASFQLIVDVRQCAITKVATAPLVRRPLRNKVIEQLLIGLAALRVIAGRVHNDVEAPVGFRGARLEAAVGWRRPV